MKSIIKVFAIITAIAILLGALFLFVRKKLQEEWGAIILLIPLYALKNAADEYSVENYQYTKYKCYDYHLKCYSKDDYISEPIEATYFDHYHKSFKGNASFQQISDVHKSQFIYAYWENPKSTPKLKYEKIMQNPNNYVDVFKDWTITKIEFFCYEDLKGKQSGTCTNAIDVIMSTTDEKVISDLRNCILNDKTTDELKNHLSYTGEYYSDNKIYSYIRVHFAESDNIIWETEIFRYISESEESSLIYIDSGREAKGYGEGYVIQSLIHNYPELKNWMNEGFKIIDSQ